MFSFLYRSLLKVILLQSSEVSDSVTETKPVDFISLSGVCLMNNRGTWKIQVGTCTIKGLESISPWYYTGNVCYSASKLFSCLSV